jgi:GNAT superfamily N-acetyltransferase
MSDETREVRIVPAVAADAEEILGFIRALAVYEKLEHEVTTDAETLRRSLFGPKAHAEVLFLEEGEKKVGFALFFHSFSTFMGLPGIYLEDLFVRPEARGRGYGKKLLAHLARLAVERGCGRLEWSVLDWNRPAIDFYLKLGAQPMAEWTVHRLTGEQLAAVAALAPPAAAR